MLAIIFRSSSFHAQHWAMSYTVHVITRMHARSHVHMDTHTHTYIHTDTHRHRFDGHFATEPSLPAEHRFFVWMYL